MLPLTDVSLSPPMRPCEGCPPGLPGGFIDTLNDAEDTEIESSQQEVGGIELVWRTSSTVEF